MSFEEPKIINGLPYTKVWFDCDSENLDVQLLRPDLPLKPEKESMWVLIETGTAREGVGILHNDPIYVRSVNHGDRIRYEWNGTIPVYTERLQ